MSDTNEVREILADLAMRYELGAVSIPHTGLKIAHRITDIPGTKAAINTDKKSRESGSSSRLLASRNTRKRTAIDLKRYFSTSFFSRRGEEMTYFSFP